MLKVEFVDEISSDVEVRMREDLVKYESSCGIDVNYKRVALTLRDENNEAVGILNAYTAFSEIYIDDMWVETSCRGKGYGRKLIDELVAHFESKGFNNINLCTSAFQAPEFYKKCGFTLEFIRENKHNPKLTKFFFVRFFKNQAQNQGIVIQQS
jgi:ribosomal protein S18 acetylase RimI-like enzyme